MKIKALILATIMATSLQSFSDHDLEKYLQEAFEKYQQEAFENLRREGPLSQKFNFNSPPQVASEEERREFNAKQVSAQRNNAPQDVLDLLERLRESSSNEISEEMHEHWGYWQLSDSKELAVFKYKIDKSYNKIDPFYHGPGRRILFYEGYKHTNNFELVREKSIAVNEDLTNLLMSLYGTGFLISGLIQIILYRNEADNLDWRNPLYGVAADHSYKKMLYNLFSNAIFWAVSAGTCLYKCSQVNEVCSNIKEAEYLSRREPNFNYEFDTIGRHIPEASIQKKDMWLLAGVPAICGTALLYLSKRYARKLNVEYDDLELASLSSENINAAINIFLDELKNREKKSRIAKIAHAFYAAFSSSPDLKVKLEKYKKELQRRRGNNE
jgi:hypothetical protein